MLLWAVYAVGATKFKSNFSLWSKFYERNGVLTHAKYEIFSMTSQDK